MMRHFVSLRSWESVATRGEPVATQHVQKDAIDFKFNDSLR